EVCSETVIRVENEIIQLRERMSELEQEISQSQHRGLELKGEADRHESRIHFNDERLVELENQHGKALHDIAEAEERGLAAEQELAALSDRLSASLASLETHREALLQKHAALHAVEEELRGHQESL